jgi:hypothetical protein
MFNVPSNVARNAEEAVDLLMSEIQGTEQEEVLMALDAVVSQLRSENWEEADVIWRRVFSQVLLKDISPRLEAIVFLAHNAMLNVHSAWRFGVSKGLVVLGETEIATKARRIEEERCDQARIEVEESAKAALRRRTMLIIIYLVVIAIGVAMAISQREPGLNGWLQRIVAGGLCAVGGFKLIRAFVVDEDRVEREWTDLVG